MLIIVTLTEEGKPAQSLLELVFHLQPHRDMRGHDETHYTTKLSLGGRPQHQKSLADPQPVRVWSLL